jgi:hypothetical protein
MANEFFTNLELPHWLPISTDIAALAEIGLQAVAAIERSRAPGTD